MNETVSSEQDTFAVNRQVNRRWYWFNDLSPSTRRLSASCHPSCESELCKVGRSANSKQIGKWSCFFADIKLLKCAFGDNHSDVRGWQQFWRELWHVWQIVLTLKHKLLNWQFFVNAALRTANGHLGRPRHILRTTGPEESDDEVMLCVMCRAVLCIHFHN